MLKTGFAFVWLCLVTFGGGDGNDLKTLEGTWDVKSLEVGGKIQPKEKAPKQIVIAGDKLTGFGPDMTIRIYQGKSPKWIDLTFKKGEKSYPVHAIYEITGQELKICLPVAEPGIPFENNRPEGFDTNGKKEAILIIKRK